VCHVLERVSIAYAVLRLWIGLSCGHQAEDFELTGGEEVVLSCSFFRSASEKTNNKKKIKYRTEY